MEEITITNENSGWSYGFFCQLCGGSQDVGEYATISFQVCDKCKSDLKEIILAKRNKQYPQHPNG